MQVQGESIYKFSIAKYKMETRAQMHLKQHKEESLNSRLPAVSVVLVVFFAYHTWQALKMFYLESETCH